MKRLPHPWHFHFQFPIPSAPTFPSPTSSLEAMACFKQLKLVVDIRPCCCLCCKSAHNFTLSEHTRLLLGPGPALGFHQSDWHLSFPGTCLGFRADGITYFAKETPEVSLKCNKVECGVAESSIEVSPLICLTILRDSIYRGSLASAKTEKRINECLMWEIYRFLLAN